MNLVPDGVRMNKRFGLNGGILIGLNADFGLYKIQADYFISPGLNGLYFPSYSAFGISAELLIGWRF